MFEDPKEDPDSGYWPSVSDLFMTLFIVAIAMVFAIYFYATSKKGPDPDFIVEGDGILKEEIRKPVNHMKKNGLNESELLRPQQPIREVVDALGDTSEKIVEEIIRLKEQIKSQPEELAKTEEHLDVAHGEIEGLKEGIREEEGHLDIAHGEIEGLKERIRTIAADNANFVVDNAKLRDLQRIIRVDATNRKYTFDSGSAEMGEEFSKGLAEREFKDLAKRIVNLNRNKNDQLIVDTLEIIGHTDGEKFRHSDKGNLDEKLPEFLAGKSENIGLFHAGSNNDLGLMRALAIKRSWQNFIETHGDIDKEELKKIMVRCYSAGQTEPDDLDRTKPESYEMKNEAFRRIEIQLTKRNP